MCRRIRKREFLDERNLAVHAVIGTAAHVNDVAQGHGLLHEQEAMVFAGADDQGTTKRADATAVTRLFAGSNLGVLRRRIIQGAQG